jgi:hypothetical protein
VRACDNSRDASMMGEARSRFRVVGDLFGGHAENDDVVLADTFLDFDIGAVEGSDGQCAIQANFMLPVPDASIPAVEICSDRSAAGTMISASETL